ncbi:MAG TPA: phosphotransferase [Candidatus Limnocylindrales bacterium]|jgi:aminoglycoside phosphotransferase (APT) family kinase protein
MPEWDPEIELDEAAVRALLHAQFRDLSLEGLTRFASGWDNALWATSDRVVFRFPRRAIARRGVEREMAVLPTLAPLLPLPIPVPEWLGQPSDAFPWPFFGARLLAGREIAEVDLDGRRQAFGAALGGFLRALHADRVVTALHTQLPRDPLGRADMLVRVPRTRERLDQLAAAGIWQAPPAVEAILLAASTLAPTGKAVVVHGDLHVRHVLVDAAALPSAVIDWGDVCVADPAVDLSLYWSVLDEGARSAFRGAYGPLSSASLLRARVLALFLDAALALYARDTGNALLLAQTLGNLDRNVNSG